jgi:hypothetical protein
MKSFKKFLEEGNGLWANIHAKRKRGERPAKPGDKDYPSKEAIKSAQKEETDLEEAEGSVKRNRELFATGRISKDEFDRRMGYGKYKKSKDPSNKRLDGPGGLYKNLVKRLGEEEDLEEGSESWEAGYKRRVVKTTDPEHKEKGMNWRIKGKDRPGISIKLYKEKPSQAEFNKQMKRVAGHEFGG